MTKQFTAGRLIVQVFSGRQAMGAAAAMAAGACIRDLLKRKELVNIIFAAAPSQDEFLEALVAEENIDWPRVNAFHMDEYTGLSADAPQLFGNFLRKRIFDRLPFANVYYLNGNVASLDAECERYGRLLKQYPVDIVCMGIGENGHLAFNDPPVANFNDSVSVKPVTLDLPCRQQQVNDGCFENIAAVPARALTLTIPALLQAQYIFCMVPGAKKAVAVFNTINQDILEQYPSTILRRHSQAILYLDADSGGLLK